MNCGLIALENLSELKNISMRTLIAIAEDNGLKLYSYKIPLKKLSLVPRPAIFHAEDHFIYVSSEQTIPDNLKYTGYILLTQKANYPKIGSVDLKRITGGSWGAIAYWTAATVATAMTANSVVQMIQGPMKIPTVSIPGALGARGLSPAVATALQKQRTELERLQQEELKRQEELAKIEAQVAVKQKTENLLSKYGLFLVAGGAVLVTVLAVRKRKKK